jgi:hypothetical protein
MSAFYQRIVRYQTQSLVLPGCMSLQSNKGVGAKVTLCYRHQTGSLSVHLEGAKIGVLSHKTKWSKKWRGLGDLELVFDVSCKVANEKMS